MAPQHYTPVAPRASFEGDRENESAPFNGAAEKHHAYRRRTWAWISSPVWFFVALSLCFICIGQALYNASIVASARQDCSIDATVMGYPTEFDAVKPAIKLEQRRFTNAIRHFGNGSLFTAWDPDALRFTTSGASFEEVDKAWDSLLHGRYVRLTEGEIDWINSDALAPLTPINNLSYVEPATYGGPDMLHSLHCINGLRKHLDYEHYKDHMPIPEEYRKMHIDHCVDQLRQAVLCHGDMTPVTLKPVALPDGHVWALLGETEFSHTCRNGAELREWWRQRGNETGRLNML